MKQFKRGKNKQVDAFYLSLRDSLRPSNSQAVGDI